MPTKTFSSRVDEEKLSTVEEIARRDAHVSFGQYCGSLLVDYIYEVGELPILEKPTHAQAGLDTMIALAEKHGASKVSSMTDEEIKELIEGRYEQ